MHGLLFLVLPVLSKFCSCLGYQYSTKQVKSVGFFGSDRFVHISLEQLKCLRYLSSYVKIYTPAGYFQMFNNGCTSDIKRIFTLFWQVSALFTTLHVEGLQLFQHHCVLFYCSSLIPLCFSSYFCLVGWCEIDVLFVVFFCLFFPLDSSWCMSLTWNWTSLS